ncbi:hypothetical protein [Actinacidiphila glaucinigra]|uniref:hypothetical protein n=1 Tax=Actinacidiphila glaucinigra TaxID=235986 RepID=UPI00366C4647
MKTMGAAGADFGLFTALANPPASPCTTLGAPLTRNVWGGTANVLSLPLASG